MITLQDSQWQDFKGAYREPYDASECLKKLEAGNEDVTEIWEELCEELHHQGDVDVASYAAIPHIVHICIQRDLMDWNTFSFVATIEECRIFGENPPLPDWLEEDYHVAIKQLAAFGAGKFSEEWDVGLANAFFAVAAFAKGMPNTGRLVISLGEDEINDAYDALFG